MSTDLYAQGAPKEEPPVTVLSDDLKYILKKRFWDGDPCGKGNRRELDDTDLPYLLGLMDAGVEDAQELRDLILDHGLVRIWID